MIKIQLYKHYNKGTSIDVLEQKKLEKEGRRPLGLAFVSFDEANDGAIYYTVDSVIYFDTVRVTVVDKFQRWSYCVYRIAGKDLIYDPISSVPFKGTLENGEITEIRFMNVKENETFLFYEGAGYKGKI